MSGDQRLYRSVLDQLLRLIDSGEFPAGGRLPPERELSERFGVSRPTIREAIIALEALNRVRVRSGSGVYVLERPESGNGVDRAVSAFELTEARALIDKFWYVRDNSPSVRQSYQSICQSDGQARIDEHQVILDALRARDPAAARTAMHQHFSRILDKLISAEEEEQIEKIRRKTIE